MVRSCGSGLQVGGQCCAMAAGANAMAVAITMSKNIQRFIFDSPGSGKSSRQAALRLRRIVHNGHRAVLYYLGAVWQVGKDGDLMGANRNVEEAVQYLHFRCTERFV